MTLCLTKPLSYGEWCFDWVAYFSFKNENEISIQGIIGNYCQHNYALKYAILMSVIECHFYSIVLFTKQYIIAFISTIKSFFTLGMSLHKQYCRHTTASSIPCSLRSRFMSQIGLSVTLLPVSSYISCSKYHLNCYCHAHGSYDNSGS